MTHALVPSSCRTRPFDSVLVWMMITRRLSISSLRQVSALTRASSQPCSASARTGRRCSKRVGIVRFFARLLILSPHCRVHVSARRCRLSGRLEILRESRCAQAHIGCAEPSRRMPCSAPSFLFFCLCVRYSVLCVCWSRNTLVITRAHSPPYIHTLSCRLAPIAACFTVACLLALHSLALFCSPLPHRTRAHPPLHWAHAVFTN